MRAAARATFRSPGPPRGQIDLAAWAALQGPCPYTSRDREVQWQSWGWGQKCPSPNHQSQASCQHFFCCDPAISRAMGAANFDPFISGLLKGISILFHILHDRREVLQHGIKVILSCRLQGFFRDIRVHTEVMLPFGVTSSEVAINCLDHILSFWNCLPPFCSPQGFLKFRAQQVQSLEPHLCTF